jgi:hypothetical protein
MNVSQKHLMVLLLAKNSGERFFADYFGKFDFFFRDEPLKQEYYCRVHDDLKSYENYQKIICIDHPYRIVYKEFLKNSDINWKIKTNSLEKQREDFTFWFDRIFYNDIDYLNDNCALHQLSFLLSRDFANINPDYVIKKDTYFEDLQKLPFYDATKTNQKLDFLLQPSMDYQKVISESQAKKIFHFFQDYFNKFGFDPFTFTTEELTKQEKVNFIHS